MRVMFFAERKNADGLDTLEWAFDAEHSGSIQELDALLGTIHSKGVMQGFRVAIEHPAGEKARPLWWKPS